MRRTLFLCLLSCVGCADEYRQAQIEYAKEHNIPISSYTSPTTKWKQKTLDISNNTGVPLSEVRTIYADEGQKATRQTLKDHGYRATFP